MSAGIGHLQQSILNALETRLGGDVLYDQRGYRAWLTFGTHDLRRLSRELAKKMDGVSNCNYASESWKSSFSRAIGGLANRRLIEIIWLVPIRGIEPEFETPAIELDDDLYLTCFSSQRRFAETKPESITLNRARASKYCADLLC